MSNLKIRSIDTSIIPCCLNLVSVSTQPNYLWIGQLVRGLNPFVKKLSESGILRNIHPLGAHKQRITMRQMTSKIKPRSVKRTTDVGNLDLGSSSGTSKLSDMLKITLFGGRGIMANPHGRLGILTKPSTRE